MAPDDPPALVHDAFLAQVARTPDAPALSSHHGTCSYRELEQASAAIAQQLTAAGVGKGAVVAIFAERGPALVFALLGALRSGAAFQILDAAYPLPRLLACAQQARPAFLLATGEMEPPEPLRRMAGSDEAAADVSRPADPRAEERWLRVPARPSEVLASLGGVPHTALPGIDPGDIAYVSFTSGSTGTPKGIVTAHAPLPHFVAWHVRHGGLTADDRFSMLSGLGHDPLLRDVFTPLSIGATLCIPEQATIFDADALWAWFGRERISVAHLTPAMGEILVTGAAGGAALAHLRRLYWGGDVLRPRLVERIARVAPQAVQTNFYGATETPQAMAFFDLAELAGRDAVPVGRGIDGAQLLVVNERRELCAPGELGEIWIRTPYLSKGYLDDAEQTRARFVSNPFTAAPADLCYRTGDRGRYLADGDVLFAGRADHQVKIRGFRVEPAEIVAALERLPAVERAVVLARERHGEPQLVAYVVGRSATDDAALRQALARELPAYMVPTAIVPLAEFPLLPNGKIDLQALPAPSDESTTRRVGAGRLPRTEAERKLAALWAEILGLEQVSIDESFLDLGGDSLAAIRALSRMRRLGLPEQVARGIFQGKTIAELSGEGASDAVAPAPLTGAAKTTLLINVLRGLLVLTLVADHWKEGFYKRFPNIPQALTQALEPIFHLPTPGFAFAFGLGLGHTQYETYLKNPGASRRMLRGGAAILAIGTLVMGLSRNLGVVARGLPLDYHEFCTNFFLPTLYYWMALATAPVWFALVARREGRWGGSLLAAAGLVVVCRALYELCRWLLLPHEQTGLLQLGRLMLTARFSYFNLSTGALLGLCFGIYLRRQRGPASLASRLVAYGAALIASGLALHYAQRDVHPDSLSSDQLFLSKWLVAVGGTLLLGALVEVALLASRSSALRGALSWIGVVGQCAMPIFILQGMVFDIAAFGRWFGLRDGLAVAVALGSFVSIIGWLMWRVHSLYHGAIGPTPAKPRPEPLPA